MKIPQVIVGIAGKNSKVTFFLDDNQTLNFGSMPEGVNVKEIIKEGKSADVIIEFANDIKTPSPYYQIQVILETDDNKSEFAIPLRIFGEREFFITFVLQSNNHIGWNPRDMRQYYSSFRKNLSAPAYRKKIGTQGDESITGNSFIHFLGDEEQLSKLAKKYRYKPLEAIFHEHQIPITWLLDGKVANEYKDYIIKWKKEYFDCVGYLPTSYFHHNNVSYNYQKTAEETIELLQQTISEVESAFNDVIPFYSNFAGVDQWVGSIGTNWVKAADHFNLDGLWGMGWDHRKCDTSMFHRGAPWNAYKCSEKQFRCVMRPGEKRKLWLFQWTIRDLVNTLPISPYGSVCFSTDPDDIKSQGIMQLEHNPTYFFKLFKDYYENFIDKQLEHFIFLVHQEDHDAHIKEDNEYLEEFVEELQKELPSFNFGLSVNANDNNLIGNKEKEDNIKNSTKNSEDNSQENQAVNSKVNSKTKSENNSKDNNQKNSKDNSTLEIKNDIQEEKSSEKFTVPRLSNNKFQYATVATLAEVALWLNIKYKPEESNYQFLEIHDPLNIETRKKIQKNYFHKIAMIYDPEEEEEIWDLLNKHWPADRNIGTTLAYFDQKSLWLAEYENRIPTIHYDYTRDEQNKVDEQGELIISKIPEIANINEYFGDSSYHLEFQSSTSFINLPWIIWKKNIDSEEISKISRKIIKVEGSESIVIYLDVKKGNNRWIF